MSKPEKLIEKIRTVFSEVAYPGDDNLSNSIEGDEPYLLDQDFRGKTDWASLDAHFLDQAPDDFSSALSFFTAQAFRFYIPAYLIADLQNELERVNPDFYLCHGLTDDTRKVRINPERYGDLTWFEYVSERFGGFSQLEYQAIAGYLDWKKARARIQIERNWIEEALVNFWLRMA